MPSQGHWNARYDPKQPNLLDDLPTEILLDIVKVLQPDLYSHPRRLFLEDLRQLSLVNRKLRRVTFAALFLEITLSHVSTVQPLRLYSERIEKLLACTPVLNTARHLNIDIDATRLIQNQSYGKSPAMQERRDELFECARLLLKVLEARCSTLKGLSITLKGPRLLRSHYVQEFVRCKIEFPALETLNISAGGPLTFISSCPNLKHLEIDADSDGFLYDEVLMKFQIALEHMKNLPCLEHLGLYHARERRIVSELGCSNLGVRSFSCARNGFTSDLSLFHVRDTFNLEPFSRLPMSNPRGFFFTNTEFQWLNELAKLPNIEELFLPNPSGLSLNRDRDEETPPLFSRIRTSFINKTIRRRAIKGPCRDTYVAARYAFAFLPRLEKLWVGSENVDNNGQAYTRLWLQKSGVYFQSKIKDDHGIAIKDINQLNSATDFWLRRI